MRAVDRAAEIKAVPGFLEAIMEIATDQCESQLVRYLRKPGSILSPLSLYHLFLNYSGEAAI